MKLQGIFLSLIFIFYIKVNAQPDIPEELEDILREIVKIKNETIKIKSDVSLLLGDAENLTIVHNALEAMYNTNLNICFNYCAKSVDEKKGANISATVTEFLNNMNKFSDKFATKIMKIVKCAHDKYHKTDITFDSFDGTVECIEQFFKPIPNNLRRLLNNTKELTHFLKNITTRIQFDCFILLLNRETDKEREMAEAETARCLNSLGQMLEHECEFFSDIIMKKVQKIKDYYQLVTTTYVSCEQDKMRDIRNRLVNRTISSIG